MVLAVPLEPDVNLKQQNEQEFVDNVLLEVRNYFENDEIIYEENPKLIINDPDGAAVSSQLFS